MQRNTNRASRHIRNLHQQRDYILASAEKQEINTSLTVDECNRELRQSRKGVSDLGGTVQASGAAGVQVHGSTVTVIVFDLTTPAPSCSGTCRATEMEYSPGLDISYNLLTEISSLSDS